MKAAKITGAAIAVVSLVALAGCSGTGSGSSSSGDLSGTVTFWHAYSADSPEVQTLEGTIIPGFEKLHPGVTVKDVAIPYDDLHQKLITAVAGDQLPDVVRSDISWVPELANLGVLEPLDTSLADFKDLADKTYPGSLATNLWKGHYYGLPLDTNTRVLMYNQDVLTAAGIASPPATMKELVADAPALKAAGAYAYADSGAGGWNVLPFIWSNGGDITNSDVTKATGYMNGKAAVEAVQTLVDLHKSGYLPDLILGDTGGLSTSDGLAQGTYATILDGPWMFPIFASQYPNFKLKDAAVPAGADSSVSVVGGEDVVLTKSSQNKEAAKAFIDYLLSSDSQLAMAKVGQMPVLKDLGSQLTDINAYYAQFATQLQTAKPRPATPAWTQIDSILQDAVRSAIKGDVTVQAALDDAASQSDALLAKYSK
ncbi:extracellular solute-binding protein [soil metagenome]